MFLYIARGSAGEVRSMLRYLHAGLERKDSQTTPRPSPETSNLKSEISNLRSQITPLIGRCESISRQLHGWANSLQNGDIKGVRHLTDQNKAAYQNRKLADKFWEQNRRAAKAQLDQRLREMRASSDDTDAPGEDVPPNP